MSRIGKHPIPVPSGVDITLDGLTVTVKGPKGSLTQTMPSGVGFTQEGDEIVVTRDSDLQAHRARHGLVRSLIANMVDGVTQGYEKKLEMVGVGYRAAQKGSDLEIQVGFSHPVDVKAPDGITLVVTDQTKISVTGIDKTLVGQVAANIRKIRPPEPYKGKGIKYIDEVIRRKAGKAAGR
jgi:large subunit ribosomal protein L6